MEVETAVCAKLFRGETEQVRKVIEIKKEKGNEVKGGNYMLDQSYYQKTDEIIEHYGRKAASLIPIMQDIQAEYKYLSPEVLERIAQKLDIGVAKVYSVATFYENFSLEAKGRHIIKVCTGTACHVRKSGPIYDSLRDALGLTGKRKTSADGLFTLETVACLGACGLAPVMTIDGEVHAKMTPEDALALVEDIRRKEAATA